jgi:hypothetical protein
VLRFEARISAAEARRVEVRVDVAGVLGDEASADGAPNTARRRSRRFLTLTDADPSGISDATTPSFPPPPPPPPRTGSSPPPASVAASLADALEDVGETAETEWRRGALILDPSGLVPTSDESAGRNASLRWNRIAWRDVSGAGGELLLRAVAFESRVAAAADGDGDGDDAAFSPSDLAPAPPAPLAPSGPTGDPPGDPPASASSTSPSTSAPAKVDASEDASPVAAFAPVGSGESSSLTPFLLVAFVVAVSALVAVLLAAYVIERRKRHASRVSKRASVDERGVREGPGSGTRRPHRGKTNRGTAAVSSGRRPPLAPASRD